MKGLNNPGNIRHGKSKWQGMSADQPSKGFVKFDSLDMGYRAMWILLSNHYHLHGCTTVARMIAQWAPPCENRTTDYIQHMAQYMGIGPYAQLPPPGHGGTLWLRFAQRMTNIEQGIPLAQVNDAAIRRGFRLAFGRVLEEA